MLISDLITTIREDYLSDTFSGWESATQEQRDQLFLWTDKALYRYITRAQQQACNRTDFIYDDVTPDIVEITLVDGQRDYDLSEKITAIENIIYDNKPVKQITKRERDKYLPEWNALSSMRECAAYIVRGRKISFYYLPDATDDGEKVYLKVYRMPLEDIVDDSSTLEIPAEYHFDLINWVIYEAYSKHDADTQDNARALLGLEGFNNKFGEYVTSEVRLNQLQEPNGLHVIPTNYTGRLNIDNEIAF